MALSPFNHKSSVLCPKTTHFTSQYLALEQIEAHHKMISHAKHNLDMSAPKSMKSYIGNMSTKKKNLWSSESYLRHQYANSLENMSEIQSIQKNLGGSEKYDEDKETIHTSLSLNKSIQAGNSYPLYNSKIADKISWYLEAVSQGEFQTSPSHSKHFQNNGHDQYGSHLSLSSSLRSRKIIKGDLIEWHKNHFTSDEHSFSPRILVNNHAKSKIRDMRCYNPPRQKPNNRSEESSDTFESDDDDDEVDEESESEVKDLTANEEIKDFTSKDDNELVVDETNTDHRSWANEQALKTDLKHEFNEKVKHQQNWLNSLKLHAQIPNVKNLSSLPFNKYEEDNYLKFLIKVTEDILKSGIYSDRAIQQTFEFHLQFCPENNDKEKLKQVLDQMLEGLKILSDDSEDVLSERSILTRRDIPDTFAEKHDINSRNNYVKLQSVDNITLDNNHDEPTPLLKFIDSNNEHNIQIENKEMEAS